MPDGIVQIDLKTCQEHAIGLSRNGGIDNWITCGMILQLVQALAWKEKVIAEKDAELAKLKAGPAAGAEVIDIGEVRPSENKAEE